MKQFLHFYYRVLKRILVALVFLLIIPVFLQVFSRFIPGLPRYIWTEEMARFAFVWMIMIGAILAVREDTHFKIDVLPVLHPHAERWLQGLNLFLLLIFAFVFVFAGWQYAKFGLGQQSEIAGLPMLSIYVAWPLTGLSWILFIMEKTYDFLHEQASGT